MSAAIGTRLVTAEEYLKIPEDGRLTELVRGRIVEMNRPFTSHGYFCGQVAFLLTHHVKEHGLGRIVTNDAGVVTQRDPDTVRGPDVAYYSYRRIPLRPGSGGLLVREP